MIYDLRIAEDQEAFKQDANDLYKRMAKVELRESRQKRSLSQNAIFHLWVAVIAEHFGELDLALMKDELKRLHLGERVYYSAITGEERTTINRTRDLSQDEMTDFLTRLKTWAESEYGILLPSPEDREAFNAMQQRYNNR